MRCVWILSLTPGAQLAFLTGLSGSTSIGSRFGAAPALITFVFLILILFFLLLLVILAVGFVVAHRGLPNREADLPVPHDHRQSHHLAHDPDDDERGEQGSKLEIGGGVSELDGSQSGPGQRQKEQDPVTCHSPTRSGFGSDGFREPRWGLAFEAESGDVLSQGLGLISKITNFGGGGLRCGLRRHLCLGRRPSLLRIEGSWQFHDGSTPLAAATCAPIVARESLSTGGGCQ
jgi:hypothetical protein